MVSPITSLAARTKPQEPANVTGMLEDFFSFNTDDIKAADNTSFNKYGKVINNKIESFAQK